MSDGSALPLTARLYINETKDGIVKFITSTDTLFEGVGGSSIAFADIDGDGDQDLCVTGLQRSNGNEIPIAGLYANAFQSPSSVRLPIPANLIADLTPNPIIGGEVSLNYQSEKQSEILISICDISGTTLLKLQLHVSEGPNTIRFDCSTLPKGTYVVLVQQEDHSTSMKLLIE